MEPDVVQVGVRAVLPAKMGVAVFVGNEEKVFVVYVDHCVGAAITRVLQPQPVERPLTHDLIGRIFRSLGIALRRIVINDLKEGTFYARLILEQRSDIGTNLVEIDARPSDCLALALAEKAPIFVARQVFDEVEDMRWYLRNLASESDASSDEESEDESPGDPDAPEEEL